MKSFCCYCNKDVELTLEERNLNMEIKGVKFEYSAKLTYCIECGNEVYSAQLDDENIENANKKYREAAGLIQIAEIEEILNKYNIGKKPLANLLGWGETTIIRYLDGLTPSREYSERLKYLLRDPSEMEALIQKNRDKISDTAACRVKKSIKAMFESKYVESDKIIHDVIDVSKFFLSKIDTEAGQDITHLKLQKLAYYCQAWALAFYQRPLIQQDCFAWVHGPVYKDIYYKFRDYKYLPLLKIIDFDENMFNEEQRTVLNGVWKVYGKYDAKYLEEMTHQEEPWLNAREGCTELERCDKVIEKDSIREYYSNLKRQFDIQSFDILNKYVANIDIEF